MYCGCPVIASYRTSIPEVCGDAAMYCDATSAEDIAEKIALMMTQSALRQGYRAKGKAHAQAYRWDRSAKKLLDVLYGKEPTLAPEEGRTRRQADASSIV
jgi:glycosyltransferase involved in cell wall biosynthesis